MVTLKYCAAALENMWLKRQEGTDEGCSHAWQRHLLSFGLSPKLKHKAPGAFHQRSEQNKMQMGGLQPQHCSNPAPPSEKSAHLKLVSSIVFELITWLVYTYLKTSVESHSV